METEIIRYNYNMRSYVINSSFSSNVIFNIFPFGKEKTIEKCKKKINDLNYYQTEYPNVVDLIKKNKNSGMKLRELIKLTSSSFYFVVKIKKLLIEKDEF